MRFTVFILVLMVLISSCKEVEVQSHKTPTADEILGNVNYPAISYGSFRAKSRDYPPSVEEIKEDMLILHALGFRVIRTYHTQSFADTRRVLVAIDELRQSDPDFEMYVVLGAWIQCSGAWTKSPDHGKPDSLINKLEIDSAVSYARQWPDIVKVITVGNESMVHWAASYFVEPVIVLELVRYLQNLKSRGELPVDLWISSSDNFASWGGGDSSYYKPALYDLIREVDYVSLHTYPFHDTHYNHEYWPLNQGEIDSIDESRIKDAMPLAIEYARNQYYTTRKFIHNVDPHKEVHIGETGWASVSSGFYGDEGSRAAGELQQRLYYDGITRWTRDSSISCFFFEAFDESWKDPNDPLGSENHFGLIDIEGRAKYVLRDSIAKGKLDSLTRGGREIQNSSIK